MLRPVEGGTARHGGGLRGGPRSGAPGRQHSPPCTCESTAGAAIAAAAKVQDLLEWGTGERVRSMGALLRLASVQGHLGPKLRQRVDCLKRVADILRRAARFGIERFIRDVQVALGGGADVVGCLDPAAVATARVCDAHEFCGARVAAVRHVQRAWRRCCRRRAQGRALSLRPAVGEGALPGLASDASASSVAVLQGTPVGGPTAGGTDPASAPGVVVAPAAAPESRRGCQGGREARRPPACSNGSRCP